MALPLPISIEQFRANLAHFVGRVVYGKERIVVQRYSRDAIVVLSTEEYARLIRPDTVKQLEKPRHAGLRLRRMYASLMKLQGLGSHEIADGSTTIDELLYGERGAWRGSAQYES